MADRNKLMDQRSQGHIWHIWEMLVSISLERSNKMLKDFQQHFGNYYLRPGIRNCGVTIPQRCRTEQRSPVDTTIDHNYMKFILY